LTKFSGGLTDGVIEKIMPVILSAAKNPEGDGFMIQANILWILHSGRRGDLRSE
jgi:hypothetical protein